MDPSEQENQDESEWKKVEKKAKDKLKKSVAGSQSVGIEGSTKASKATNAAAPPPPRDPKAEAAKRRGEKEKRFNTGRKVASMPQVSTGRSSSGSSDEGSDSERPKGKEDRQKGQVQVKAFKVRRGLCGGIVSGTILPGFVFQKDRAEPGLSAQSTELQAALKKIDYKALAEEVTKAKSAQGNDKWVRLVADRLNEKLAGIPIDNNFYSEDGFVWGYPLNVAPRELTDFMYGVFSSCPKNFLEAYLNWTVNDACRTYISQRKGFYGSQLIIQYLLKSTPDLVSEKSLSERIGEVRSYQSRKDELLAIMWSYGQTGLQSFTEGLHVWYRLMFPLINSRGYTGFCIAYLDRLLRNHKNHDLSKVNKQEVFMNMFDAFHGTNSTHFHRSTKAGLASLYQKLQDLMLKKNLKETAKDFFPQFLMRLGLQQPKDYVKRASENLLLCLRADPGCYDFWITKYPSSLRETQILLEYIATNNDDVARKVRNDKRFMSFIKQVDDYQPGKNKKAAPALKQDYAAVRDAVQKIRKGHREEWRKKRRTRIGWLFLLVATLVAAEVIYHGTEKSQVIRSWNVSKPYITRTWNTVQPFVIRTWNNVLKPFLQWAWTQTGRLLLYAGQVVARLWGLIEGKLPAVYDFLSNLGSHMDTVWRGLGVLSYQTLHKVDTMLIGFPTISEMFSKLSPAYEFAKQQVMNVSSHLQPYLEQVLETYGPQNGSKATADVPRSTRPPAA